MNAIERCRTAALGGHVARCADCAHEHIAYNSCRNRHCPKCQAGAAKTWLAAREAELLPVRYFHLVFTLPRPIADIAYQNKREIYNLLMRASADTVIRIAADPKHLGARVGITSVLHTWGSAMTHHPHVHMIVPGGGLSADGSEWIACRKNFFLSARVLSRLYRRLILEGLAKLHKAGKLHFFGDHAGLVDATAFDTFLQPLRKIDWVVYAKEPFAGPKAVLAYLSRYTHRIAISNSRLVRFDARSVTFRVKDYRLKGAGRHTILTLAMPEFIRRFLIHVLPKGPKGPEAVYLGFCQNIPGTSQPRVFFMYSTTSSAGNLNPRPSDTRSTLTGYFGLLGLMATTRNISLRALNVRP